MSRGWLYSILAMGAIFTAFDAYAQSGSTLWTKQIGGTGAEKANAVTVDHGGNIIVTGTFEGTVDFGGTTLTTASASAHPMFIAKYDSSGTLLWVVSINGFSQVSRNVAVDANDNIVVGGNFYGTVDFGGPSGPMQSGNTHARFLAKFGPDGSNLWSVNLGNFGGSYRTLVAVDANGDVLAAGDFGGTIDVGTGPLVTNGDGDFFVAKFAGSNGSPVWAKSFGGEALDSVAGVAVDSSNNVVITGFFYETITFGGDTLTQTENGLGPNVFLAKLSSSGAHTWSKSFTGAGWDVAAGLAVDPQNNIILTGYFSDTIDLGGIPLQSAGSEDIFVAKYNPSGGHVWSKRFGGTGWDVSTGVAADASGNVILIGQFRNTAGFGGAIFTAAGWADMFVAKFNSNGDHLWSKQWGSPNDTEAEAVNGERPASVAVDGSGNVVVYGDFTVTSSIAGSTMTSAGGSDLFIARLGP